MQWSQLKFTTTVIIDNVFRFRLLPQPHLLSTQLIRSDILLNISWMILNLSMLTIVGDFFNLQCTHSKVYHCDIWNCSYYYLLLVYTGLWCSFTVISKGVMTAHLLEISCTCSVFTCSVFTWYIGTSTPFLYDYV